MKSTARIAAMFSRSGVARDSVFGADAMPVVSRHARGIGAPAARRALLALITALAAIAGLAITAAAASADPPSVTTPVVSNVSYTSVHIEGKVTTDGSGLLKNTAYAFQYSTDETTWSTGYQSGFGTNIVGAATGKIVEANITLPKGGTEYFIRLGANNGAFFGAANPTYSPLPNPSFTTLAVDPPAIPGSVEASEIFSLSAKATAEVERPATADPAFNVECRFEYITDAQFEENVSVNSLTGFEGATPVDCEQNPIEEADAGVKREVTAHLTGLSPSTAYHLRLVAENAAPEAVAKEAADTFTTGPKVEKPTAISVSDAGEVTIHGAKFSGEIQRPAGADPALDVECRFEFVNDKQFGEAEFAGAASAPCVENPITAATVDNEGKQIVTAEFGGFSPATTWHFRLAAENAGGVDTKDATGTFTTLPAELPVVTIDPVEGGTYTTAHVSGTVEIDDPGQTYALPYVEVSTDGGATWPGGFSGERPSVSGSGPQIVEKNFTGLQPNTTYTFRVKAAYGSPNPDVAEANGEMAFSPEPNPSITTEPLFAPTATINPVSGVTGTAAHLSGTVDPHAPAGPLSEAGKRAFETHWEFVCTPECKNVNGNPIAGTVQGEEGAQGVAGDARRLEPNRHYEVSLLIHSEGGEETLGPEPFDTPVIPPSVQAAAGSSDGHGGYTLQGVVNPNNSPVTACEFRWGPNAPSYAFSAPCSPPPGGGSRPVTVEAHLTGLTPGATYHDKLVVTYGAGVEADGGDQSFVPTLSPAESCPSEQIRNENSSEALPECRAYEMVTPPDKGGYGAELVRINGGAAVAYKSQAGNIANSGFALGIRDYYTAVRSEIGWQTRANLNGPTGSVYDGPDPVLPGGFVNAPPALSKDLLSSVWSFSTRSNPEPHAYLRKPDGSFTPISGGAIGGKSNELYVGAADDFSDQVYNGSAVFLSGLGPGVYQFVGPASQPRRVDVDNFSDPISGCDIGFSDIGNYQTNHAIGNAVSTDGRVVVLTAAGGCGAPNPPTREIWARIDGTTSVDVSASRCNRIAPAEPCNAPAPATFQGAATDGSRVYFITAQQLVDGDTDQTSDLYACDIASGTPAPVGLGNPCSSLTEISGAHTGANVQNVLAVSADGSTVYFTAKGVLADNTDAFGNAAIAGDNNIYVWRTDAAHSAGQTTFIAPNVAPFTDPGIGVVPDQVTPDGRDLVLTTATPLLPTDTDNAADVYRYDVEGGVLNRVSTNANGVGGNVDGLDANAAGNAISDDGQKIVFITAESLVPTDGNGNPDVYLWSPGHVTLTSSGSGPPLINGNAEVRRPAAAIDGSGEDIYFETAAALTPADGDEQSDVYDARVNGGFSFADTTCSGEVCQPPVSLSPPTTPRASEQPGPGNPSQPRACPKGKVRKHSKCVMKNSGAKHHKKPHKKTGHNRGGSK